MNASTYPIRKKSKKSSISPMMAAEMIFHWFSVSVFCLSSSSNMTASLCPRRRCHQFLASAGSFARSSGSLFAVRGVRDANGKHLFTLSHPRQAVIRIDKCELRLPGRPSRTARAVALGPATRFAPRTAVGEPNYASRKQSFSRYWQLACARAEPCLGPARLSALPHLRGWLDFGSRRSPPASRCGLWVGELAECHAEQR